MRIPMRSASSGRPGLRLALVLAALLAPSVRAQGALASVPPEVLTYGPYVVGVLVVLLVGKLVRRRRREATARGVQVARDRAKILLKNGRPDAAAREIETLQANGGELTCELLILQTTAYFESNQDDQGDRTAATIPRDELSLKQRYELARCLEKARREDAAKDEYRAILLEDADFADVKMRLERVSGSDAPRGGGGVLGFGYDPSSIARHLSERYMKMELIGKGGMGFVFRAFDQKRKRTVAIKALSPFLAEEGEAVHRFMREARILSKFEHPNVVKIFDVEEKPIVFYTMEFLKGRTLGHRLEEEGPLSVKELMAMGEALLLGLVHIHGHGVVHRDIKPENVLLDTDGTPRFTDFGLAVGDQATRITQAGQVMGTLRYMAPEQMRGESVGPTGDIFSLGVTLYEAATGIHAFSGEDRIHRQLSGRIQDVTDREIPDGVVSLIELMMEKAPEDRVQTAAEALEMIRSLKQQVSRRGPVTFVDETLSMRLKVVQPLAGFFGALAQEGDAARREFFEESSNVRDLKLLVWRLNESIGRIQAAGSPPKGSDPRAWAPETGQIRTDLARFVRNMELGAIDAFSLRLRRLDKQLEEFLVPLHLQFVTKVLQPLESAWSGSVMVRLPPQDCEVYGAPQVRKLQDELGRILHGLFEAGRPVLQEVAVRWKPTAEGDRVLLQITGDGVERGHEAAAAELTGMGIEVGFAEPGLFKAWFPLVLEDEESRAATAAKEAAG